MARLVLSWSLILLIAAKAEAFAPHHASTMRRTHTSFLAVTNSYDHNNVVDRTPYPSNQAQMYHSPYTNPNHQYWYPEKDRRDALPDMKEDYSFAIRNEPSHVRVQESRRDESITAPTSDSERVVAAGIGTGVLATLVAGPIGGAILGFSAAYAAQHNPQNDVVGDSARAVGEIALHAKNKSMEINSKHKVVDKTLLAARDAWETAKELDRQHKLVQKARDVAVYGSTATVDFVRRHKLVERGIEGLGNGVVWLTERVVAGSLSGKQEEEGRASLETNEYNRHMNSERLPLTLERAAYSAVAYNTPIGVPRASYRYEQHMTPFPRPPSNFEAGREVNQSFQ